MRCPAADKSSQAAGGGLLLWPSSCAAQIMGASVSQKSAVLSAYQGTQAALSSVKDTVQYAAMLSASSVWVQAAKDAEGGVGSPSEAGSKIEAACLLHALKGRSPPEHTPPQHQPQ